MAVYYSRCNHECSVALQEVTLPEASRGFLHKLRFLTLSVNGINGDSAKRDTLGHLMRMDKWDVVYMQETHHNGDGTTPSYAKLFKNCGYKGGWAFLHGVTSTQYMWRCSLLVLSQTLLTGNVRHSSRAYNTNNFRTGALACYRLLGLGQHDNIRRSCHLHQQKS